MSRYPEFNNTEVQPAVPNCRQVLVEQFAGIPRAGASFAEFLESFPHIYAGSDIRTVVDRVVTARRQGRAVILSCGAHVVKCGLAPALIALMEEGLVTAVAVNGAFAIHDVEIACYGTTSEKVEQGLKEGTFGMAAEPAAWFNRVLTGAREEQLGAGEALGRELVRQQAPFRANSLLAAAYRLEMPMTVHIAIGTDIVHMHPNADGAAYGETSLRDFRILTAAMRSLAGGGVLVNLGSAVLLPEVLLKAVALLRHENPGFTGFLGVDCDFIRQYRATLQVVNRIGSLGGEGIALTGHHEILIPLLSFAIMEAWQAGARRPQEAGQEF